MSHIEESHFQGLRVAGFESRRAADLTRLIEGQSGVSYVSASMREVPLDDNQPVIDFAHRLITGEVEVLIVLTGVGFRHLMEVVKQHVDVDRFLNCLRDIVTVARGPKVSRALRDFEVTPTLSVPEPNTWREILLTLDTEKPVASLAVAVLEYGRTNPSLIAGLEARGAMIVNVPVYRWALPEDIEPLKQNVTAIAAGERDVLLFTSAMQVHHFMKVADGLDVESDVRRALRKCVVASVGPTTSEALRECQLPVDLQPEHPKMGPLVRLAAERAHQLLERKQRVTAMLSGALEDVMDENAPWFDSPFMKACRLEPTDVTPVWMMRQAGRYMAEYREVRSKMSFLDLCKNPQLCSGGDGYCGQPTGR